MKLNSVLKVCLVQIVANLSCWALKNAAEEDSFIPGDHQLYEETKHYVDPNDMLADLSVRRQAFKKKGLQGDDVKDNEGSHSNFLECKDAKEELRACSARQEMLELELQSKEATNVKILEQLASRGSEAYEHHYRRILNLLLQTLHSENSGVEAGGILRRSRTFVLAEDDMTGLEHCVKDRASSGEHVRRCDELVTALFSAVEVHEGSISGGSYAWPLQFPSEWPHQLEALLLVLGLTLVLLTVWASVLLIFDVYRRRRWAPFLLLMLGITFAFCCLWNWRNMIKEVEAQRAADLERQGLGGSPEECRATGVWAWLTGAEQKCTKYYTEVFISASEQITLEQVVVRTLTSLLLSPLRALGKELGLFFNEFYGNMSFLYALPASMMFLLMLALFLFFCCRNSERPHRYGHSDAALDGVAYQQLRLENQKLMLESRTMMESIGVALHASAQRAQEPTEVVQPLLDSSCRRIERQLDTLIAARFEALTQQQAPRDPALVPPCSVSATHVQREQITSVPATDHTDGSRPAAIEGGNTSLNASQIDFVEKILTVINESFSEKDAEARSGVSPPNSTIRRRVTCSSTPLSPSSEKFLDTTT